MIQHVGIAEGDQLSATGTIVPQSGTGELRGIQGQAYEAEMGELTLQLN